MYLRVTGLLIEVTVPRVVSVMYLHVTGLLTVIGKGRSHGPFDTYSFVILCRCPIQKLKGPKNILVFTKTTLKWPIECYDGAAMAHNRFLFPDH